jgi:D-alanyl-lipoteichoic acid acyltransferase DltB (MBOAT superfamily)
MVAGFFKVTAVSAIASYAFQHLSQPLLDTPLQLDPLTVNARFTFAMVAYCAYLYYNFSGYTDIVIGSGGLMGQRLPENFDHPFRARSFLEFWTRWHMTLSNWFKLYLFNPLVTVMVGWFPSKRTMPFVGVAAFFVTFLIMGIWHGTTGVFVIYGLLMGAGASVNKLWQVALTRWLGNDGYRLLQKRSLYAGLSRGLTYAYFSCGISCLWMTIDQLHTVISVIGLNGLAATVLLLTMGSASALWLADMISVLGSRLLTPLSQGLSSSLWANRWALAAQILLVVGIASLFHKAPEFVYKAF